MRVKIPDIRDRKDLFTYLKDNKAEIIQKKRMSGITSDPVGYSDKLLTEVFATKDNEDKNSEDSILVKVVANAAFFADSYGDVVMSGAPNKSINERKSMIPHLHDHIHTTEAEVGIVKDIYVKKLSSRTVGYDSNMMTEAVIFETDVMRSYNQKIFDRYKGGRSNQHSIGLQYVKLLMAINSDDLDLKEEKDAWDKYYSKVINKEVVDEDGYFFPVLEYKLIENSVVLFGANPYTPTLSSKEPDLSTRSEPSLIDTRKSELYKNILKNLKT